MGFFYLLLVLIYFPGLFEDIGINKVIIKYLADSIIVGYFIAKYRTMIFPKKSLIILSFLIVLISVISTIINNQGVLFGVQYARFAFLSMLLFYIAFNFRWSFSTLLKFERFFAVILIVQVIFSLKTIFITNNIEESVVGTITRSGGEIAATLPMFALAPLLSKYLYIRKKRLLLLSILLITIGIASGKRAFIFYMPLIALIIYLLYLVQENKITLRYVLKSIVIAGLLVLCFNIIVNVFLFFNKNEGLGREGQSPLEYALSYNKGITQEGIITGRWSASLKILDETGEEPIKDLLGYGPKILMGKSGDFDKYKIDYGIVGWSRDVLSIGWAGMIFFVLFVYSLTGLRDLMHSAEDISLAYIKLTTSASLLIFVIVYFTYGVTFSAFGVLLYVYVIFSGIFQRMLYWGLDYDN